MVKNSTYFESMKLGLINFLRGSTDMWMFGSLTVPGDKPGTVGAAKADSFLISLFYNFIK